MEENVNYVKRTQKDYSMSFKLQIVQEIEARTAHGYRGHKEIWHSMQKNRYRMVTKIW